MVPALIGWNQCIYSVLPSLCTIFEFLFFVKITHYIVVFMFICFSNLFLPYRLGFTYTSAKFFD